MKKTKCQHQFFKVLDVQGGVNYPDEFYGDIYVGIPDKFGVQVMCALCGEQRQLWDDGSVVVKNESGEWEELKVS